MPGPARSAADASAPTVGEPRWPVALAISVFIIMSVALRLVMPHRESIAVPWVLPAAETLLLIGLIATAPGSTGRRSVWLRRLSIALLIVLALAAIWGTVSLSVELLVGKPGSESADNLLASGSLIWLGNNIVFSLLYWEFDGGGAVARRQHAQRYLELAFPQQQNPDLAPPGWQPQFVDYLYLGFTNATAFSPTDVMPLVPRAKLAMAAQSTISLVVLSLVIATAVNVLA